MARQVLVVIKMYRVDQVIVIGRRIRLLSKAYIKLNLNRYTNISRMNNSHD